MVSLKDIAAACGVSASTVSKALNDLDDISEKRKAMIRQKANEMGYLPNMAAHAVAHLPEEACGLIAGEKSDTERVIKKVYYLTNIDHTNEHFSLDPKEQLAAIKDMRKNGLEPLGNWHSCTSARKNPTCPRLI